MEKKVIIIIDEENIYKTGEGLGRKWNYVALFRLFAEDKETRIFFCYKPQQMNEKESGGFLGFLSFVSNRLWDELDQENIFFKDFPAVKQTVDSLIITKLSKILIRRLRQEIRELKQIEQGRKEVNKAKKLEKIILFSGDGGYTEILREFKKEGIEINIVSGKESCAETLKDLADKVYLLDDLIKEYPVIILKDPKNHY